MPMQLPLEVDELTPEFMSWALDTDVATVAVLDRHSGTTGRARLALTGAADVPPTVFVKLAPFVESQRTFVNNVGMGVTEARFYRDLASETGLRVPHVWFADYEGDNRYLMVLEDLEAAGCRFPSPDDDDIEFRARDIVAELAPFHARYWESERFAGDGDMAWIAPKGTASGDGGAPLVQLALDNLADRLPEGFRPLAELYVARAPDVLALYREGARTLVHGDDHMGNLFVDGTRTGFLDWAVIGYAPGIRDVAYVMCNSVPAEIRRAIERDLVADYCARLARQGVTLDGDEAWDRYRLFAVYSWVAAACTAAMGSKWQPEHVGLGGTARATIAAMDLDCVGLLESRLG
jgi:hypothetical protein